LSVTLLLALALSCAAQKKQASMRSPSYDYPAEGPWGTTISDGTSLGADRQSLSDKLRTGPTIGNRGVQGPEYPAEEEEEEEETQGAAGAEAE
jgi:hypothetical protein